MATIPSSLLTPAAPPIMVEGTSLPRITVRGKGGKALYHAYVHGYIAGPKCRLGGVQVVPLYYLSLVAARGQGTVLQGIWSAMCSTKPADVYLDTVGTVVLAHHSPSLASLGYTLHWNYTQAETDELERDLHGIIESHLLTMVDPVRGAAPARRERAARSKRVRARGGTRLALSTATRKELGNQEEMQRREEYPLFLVLLAGNEVPPRQPGEAEEVYAAQATRLLAERYFAFLDLRAPWAMARSWSSYLWARGIERGENTRLTTWFAQVRRGEEEGDDEQQDLLQAVPVFREAWLCRPNIALLATDLRDALLEGRLDIPGERDAAEADAGVGTTGHPVPANV